MHLSYWSKSENNGLSLFCFSGILLAVTSIGPAFGFITGSLMQRFYVDFDKLSKGEDSQLELNVVQYFV